MLEAKKISTLRICRLELLSGGVQTIREIVPPTCVQSSIDQVLGHLLHLPVCGCCPTLAEKHNKGNHGSVGIFEKGIVIGFNLPNRDIEQIGMVAADDCSGIPKELNGAMFYHKVFVKDVRGRIEMVQIPIRRFIHQLIS